MQFNYQTTTQSGSIASAYVAGALYTNPELLSSIEILINGSGGGTVAKDYFLSYSSSTTTGREEVTSIQECADSAKSNCLSPTTVSYNWPATGVSTTVKSALSSSGTNLTTKYDLNGDGCPDLVYYNGTDWYVSFGSPRRGGGRGGGEEGGGGAGEKGGKEEAREGGGGGGEGERGRRRKGRGEGGGRVREGERGGKKRGGEEEEERRRRRGGKGEGGGGGGRGGRGENGYGTPVNTGISSRARLSAR